MQRMNSTHRKVGSRNKYFVGGSRDTHLVSEQITDTIGTVALFLAILVMGVIFMAVSGCGNKINTITHMDETLSTVRVWSQGNVTEQTINEPFKYKGKDTIITTAKSVNMMMAINIAKMNARSVIGVSRVIEQQIMRHTNGVQYVVLITSQKI